MVPNLWHTATRQSLTIKPKTMNAPFANIFLALQQQIQNNVTDIVHVDQDLGQLKTTGRPAVSWPCALIDFEAFHFTDLGQNVQQAQGTIVIRLGFQPFSNTTGTAPEAYKEKAINYYDIEWSLNKVLQGWTPGDDFGTLSRISATTQPRTDNIRVREVRYSIAFQDYSAKPTLQEVPAIIVVTPEIVIL